MLGRGRGPGPKRVVTHPHFEEGQTTGGWEIEKYADETKALSNQQQRKY